MGSISVDRNKIVIILNYLIFMLVIIGLVIMFTGLKFTYIEEPVLETTKFGVFKFFTVDSNVLMGIVAIIMAYQEKKLLNGRIKEIPVGYYILKHVMTTAVSLTFLVVFVYLAKIAKGGLISLLQNSNLFFHLLIPVLSIITFTAFERTRKIKFSYLICSLIPVLLYGIYYVINIIVHLDNGVVSPKYDWYWFVQNGINNAYIVAIILVGITYVVGLILWIINRKRK